MSQLIKDYFNYQQEFVEKYGSNTIVLMQVGSFYEFYGLNTEQLTYNSIDANLTLDNTHLYTVAKLLGFSIAKKTNNILMAGVPKYAIDKHVKKLLDNNYTIVIIEQIGDDKKDVERKITNIYSPGTYCEDINYTKTNFLASIVVEYSETINNSILEIGVSCIDLSIGKNIIYEIPYKKDDNNYIYDELYKFINSYNPSEIIIYFKNVCDKLQNKLIETLEINKRIIKTVTYNNEYRKLEVQELILKEVFKYNNMINIFEYLNINRLQVGLYSYINLLLFIKEHDNSKLLNLEKPIIYTTNELLNLNRSTIYRLNLVDNNYEDNTSVKSLFDIINMTTTNIGKRTLKNRLLFPITNTTILNKYYDSAEYFINNTDLMNTFKKELQNISDLERLNRKLATLKLDKDSDLLNLCITIDHIYNILKNLTTDLLNLLNLTQNNIDTFSNFYNTIHKIFNIDHLYNRNINIFNTDYNETITTKYNTYKKDLQIFKELCNKFTELIKSEDNKSNNNNLVDYEWSDRDNCYNITTTESRAKKLKLALAKKQTVIIKNTTYDINISIINSSVTLKNTSSGGKTKIKSDLINICSDNLYKSKNSLEKLVNSVYKNVLEELYQYNDLLFNIVNFIGNLDCAISTASNYIKYNYCKPILDNSNVKSYFDCKDIRHPIIENILKNTLYVTNDVNMGINNNDGILLFGTNSCGKSSLMKAIGLCVIMSQAGLYVPASYYKIKPYTQIFSRIGNQDNIFTGKSSFTQEISELRDIFNRADQNSLIIGDEPCSGTEHISAISIVSASIEYLSKINSSFIFATHLHKLNEINLIKDLENLHMYHLKITYDEVNDRLIYNRKLELGIGNEEYGLEVAKSLALEKEFLNNAYKVKNQLKDIGLYSTKGSIYNSKKILHKCEICNETGEEIHHINFQSNANKFGHINTIHKNALGNLCSICSNCHDKVHNNLIIINGYIETSNGVCLDYSYVEKQEKITKKKYTDENIKWIVDFSVKNEKYTYKQISNAFEHFNKIKISPTIVSKIINNKY
jgi:DNA mismatch repair protein MutS